MWGKQALGPSGVDCELEARTPWSVLVQDCYEGLLGVEVTRTVQENSA